MKTLALLALLSTAWGTSPPDKPKHKAIDALIPKSQGGPGGSAGKPTPPPPTTEHEIDRRFAKTAKTRENILAFRGDDTADLDTRACPQPYPLESLMTMTGARDPQAAKDGGVFFLSEPGDGALPRQLQYQSGPAKKPQTLTRLPAGVAYFRVSPDGKKILVGTEGTPRGELYLIDYPARTEKRLVGGELIPGVAWSSDSTWFAYTSDARNGRDLDLYRYPLGAGRGLPVASLNGYHVVTDVSPDGQAIALTEMRSSNDSDVVVWSRGRLENVTSAGVPAAAHDGRFTRDSQSVFALTDAERGTSQLYLFPRSATRKPKLLTAEPGEIDGFSLDDARSALIYRLNEDGYSRLAGWVIDARGQTSSLLAMPKFPSVVTSLASFARGSGFFYARSSPGRVWAIWRSAQPYHEVWQPAAAMPVPRNCFVAERRVRYPGGDGKPVPAFLYAPVHPTLGGVYAVLAHDGPAAQARPAFDAAIQYLALRGIGVLTPDVRGSTGYGRAFTDADNRRARQEAVKDLVAGGKWLVDTQVTRAGRVVALGHGYGGFLAIRALQTAPELYAAAGAAAPWLSLPGYLQGLPPSSAALQEDELGGAGDVDFLKALSPLADARTTKGRLLLLTAAGDSRTPLADAQVFQRDAKAAGNAAVELKALGAAPGRPFAASDLRNLAYFFEGK